MNTELVGIGFGNKVAMNRVLAMTHPDSALIKRAIQEKRSEGLLVDATNGRRTKTVIFTDSGHIVLAALTSETIASRLSSSGGEA